MEPPAKRLRILQSVEVDDTNPDYVNAKQKQQQKFKGRLESIFAKYEGMHDSMSDEIDMRENKVVVDRGHLRRLVRQVNRKETVLLDNLGLAAGQESDEAPEQDEDFAESEDELAPTQRPKLVKGPSQIEQRCAATTATDASSSNTTETTLRAMDPVASTPVQSSVPNTPYQAANLMQLVQFPETPAGQQAQSSFYATLAQTINQAVQQAVAPLFSSILPSAPRGQFPPANTLQIPATPITNNDRITPATDPKWFFPPLTGELQKTAATQSSPIKVPNAITASEMDASQDQHKTLPTQEQDHHKEVAAVEIDDATHGSDPAAMQAKGRPSDAPKTLHRTSPRVEVQRKRERHTQKYRFTEDDDVYMFECKKIHRYTWADIRDSRAKWKGWPTHAFHNRWHQHLKSRSFQSQPRGLRPAQEHTPTLEEQTRCSPVHHMLTPTSLEHEDTRGQDQGQESSLNDMASSNTHFDEDELELLSLTGADKDENDEQLPTAHKAEVEDAYFPDVEDVVLPSVESTEFIDEDALQQSLLESSPAQEVVLNTTSVTRIQVKIEPSLPASINKRKRKLVPMSFQAMPDSDYDADDLELDEAVPAVLTESSFVCGICNATFRNAKNLQRHQDNPRSAHDNLRPKSPSIDLIGDDDLDAPAIATPHIKREFSTPPPTSFLFSTPLPQSRSRADLLSSGIKSSSGLSRKAYLKQVKQSWTKKGTPGPRSLTKRKSLGTLPKTTAWGGDGESEDELAL
jgi:hypothetical protein